IPGRARTIDRFRQVIGRTTMNPLKPSRIVLAGLGLAMAALPGAAGPVPEEAGSALLPLVAPDKPATPFDRFSTGVVARPTDPSVLTDGSAAHLAVLKT